MRLEALRNLLATRAEVRAALALGLRLGDAPDPADALRLEDVPSTAAARAEDRVLAELDQDGFAFPVRPEDAAVFPGRARRLPRKGNLVDVVAEGGRVCVRKRFRAAPVAALLRDRALTEPRAWALRRLWQLAGVQFHAELAALLRLRDVPFVPKVRRVDRRERTIWLDFLDAESLRHAAARAGEPVHDADLPAAAARESEDDLGRREARLLDAVHGEAWRAEVASMIRAINARGVVPRDLKLGNLLRGRTTRRLYWIDFENSKLASQPGFDAALAAQDAVLRGRFGVDPDCDSVAARAGSGA